MNYYAYRYMIRVGVDNHLLRYRRLFQQYAVDMFVKMETERLNYLKYNQAQLRSDEYIHLRDAMSTEGDATNVGRLTILPSSYIGSPRHMHEYAQDAMTYVRHYGRPDLFITFTCNPNWHEIKQHLSPGQTCSDRHDIAARVFRAKVKALMDFIVKHKVFGPVRCHMYNIEWQKRGLPHAHILVWMVNRIVPEDIDNIISAEIPDPVADPDLFATVSTNMIHGPCGDHNPQSPCMIDRKCSKRYPRPLVAETIHAEDGYPLYRRRSPDDGGRIVNMTVNGTQTVIDNRWIVPYCPLLSKTFNAHINVESCQSIKSIKYVCKYITKGSDMASYAVTNNEGGIDEITHYQNGRYVSCNEAIWRTFSFPIHERYPTVQHLAVHLENGQRVYFTEATAAQRAERPPPTTLTSFFETCRTDPFAQTLKYFEMPRYYTWTGKKFQRRKQGTPVAGYTDVYSTDALGRVYTVNPKQDECFYLRLLLVNVVGPTSFESLRTVNGVLCQTYQEACQLLNLLQDDTHWDQTLAEAVITASANQLRTLFAIIISTCRPSQPRTLWDKYKNEIAEDILHRVRVSKNDMDIPMSEGVLNEALIIIEDLCFTMTGKLLHDVSMPSPNRSMHDAFELELNREKDYDVNALAVEVQRNCSLLTPEQKAVYDILMKAVDDRQGGIFFLDAPGGTGKTFVMSLILATIRARSGIALALASSGIAATLLDGGRTAHSALKLPLNMRAVEKPNCGIGRGTAMAKVLQAADIIIWDECTMAHKGGLEALDRTLRDLKGNNQLFGGVMILLSGDFRQTLPVVPRGTAADQINASLKSSWLWRKVKKLKLTQNMRVILQNDSTAAVFATQLLKIGDGKQPIDAATRLIHFPPNFCQFVNTKDELISKVFPNIACNYVDHNWLSERAILAAKNKDVDQMNFTIQNSIPGDLSSYKSVDQTVELEQAANYPTEFLNSLDLPGLPPHNLRLKVGSVVIMLRNVNPPKLCNGTRLVVKDLKPNVIKATILKGKFKGEDVMIPRIPLIPNDSPIEFKRIQFPLRLAFGMTINKSQGQSLGMCGLNLESPCFSHGQLYVACSRVGKPSDLFVYAPENKTENIVYHQALR